MDSRKRLRPWLFSKVEAGECGLRWIDREEQTFQIPWIHRSNRSWRQDYCLIFKEWAIYTGKYKDGDHEDWPMWKQRFRAALTKLSGDFKEMSQLHRLDIEEPYRVYRFVDNRRNDSFSSSYSPSSSQGLDSSPGGSSSNSSTQVHNPAYNVASPVYNVHMGNIPTVVAESGGLEYNIQTNDLSPHNPLPLDTLHTSPNPIDNQQPMSIDSSGNFPSDLQNLDSGDLMTSKLPSSELRQYNIESGVVEGPKPTLSYKIYYLDKLVKEGYLFDKGAHFYFGDLPLGVFHDQILGPDSLEQIPFPDVNQMSCSFSAEQQKLIMEILLKMDRGFHLQCVNSDIYTQRLCRTRIFGTGDTIGPNALIDRASKQTFKLFDLQDYKDKYLEHKSLPKVVLTFAQQFKFQSIGKLLIRMEVTSIEASGLLPKTRTSSSITHKSSLLLSDLNSSDIEVAKEMNKLSL